MRFDKCPYCNRYALMKKNICEGCWRKRFFNLSIAITLGKVRIPNSYKSLIHELSQFKEKDE